MKQNKSAQAFNFLDLVAIVAIVALLAAILSPILTKARERADARTCLSNQRHVAAAFMLYTVDFAERLPLRRTASGGPHGGARDWSDDIAPYESVPDMFKCPSRPNVKLGMGINAWLSWPKGCPISALKRPSATCLLAEMEDPRHKGDPKYGSDVSAPYNWGTAPDRRRSWFARDRHPGGANMAFADGHARFMPYNPKTLAWPADASKYRADTPVSASLDGTPRGTWFWPTADAP